MTQKLTIKEFRRCKFEIDRNAKGIKVISGRESIIEPARPKSVRRDDEHDLQATVFEILRLNEKTYPELKFIHSSQSGVPMSKRARGRAKASGMKRGVPDIIIPFQKRGYSAAAVETKTLLGRLSSEQREFHEFLRLQGWCVKILRSVEDILKFVEWYVGVELDR